MKNILIVCVSLITLNLSAQNFEDNISSKKQDMGITANSPLSSSVEKLDSESFLNAVNENNIPQRTLSNLEGVENGYYVISSIFSKANKLDKFVNKLKKDGFEAGYIQNPENDLYYIYLNKYSSWQKAIADCNSEFDNKYTKDVWILNVINSEEPKEPIALEEVTYDMLEEVNSVDAENSTNTSTVSLETYPENIPNKTKLIAKADEYFNKMWYAEAAELYEQALNKDQSNYSPEDLQKAGDAHYYNTNMEQAYKWYNMMYEKYGEDLSAENIFKYAHTLKGTGKYGRAKRLMRLYDKKSKNIISKENNEQREAVLDQLLSANKQFEIKNLNVNSVYSDFSPVFYNDEEVVFSSAADSSIFNTRKYKWNNQPYLDLYTAKLNKESQELTDASKLSKKINTKYHEASVAFTPDRTTMYFTRNNYGKKLKRDNKGVNHLKIYKSNLVDGEWTEATEVPFNSDNYSTGHPAISPDGKKMYFVSDMPGSIGETDIFVVDLLENGQFSEPRNLGPSINTEQKEMFPFVNEEKLYFSSNGYVGMGGLDVYEASFNEDGGFEEVKNVGQPVNSNKDDFSYIVNEETQMGYFASNRAGGKGDDDIYSFKRLVVEEVPTNQNVIAGVVTHLVTGDVMPTALVELLDENNIKLKEVVTAEDGSFFFNDLDPNTTYKVRTIKDTFFDEEIEVATVDNDTVTTNVQMKKLNEMIAIENGIKKLKTEMIHFNFDKYNIRTDAAEELDKLVSVMNEYPDMVIKIESHTDSRGSAVYNKYLSDRRAKSTRDYIISQGISADRIESAIGYGEEKLLNECNGSIPCSEEKHFLNRRSEFIIINM